MSEQNINKEAFKQAEEQLLKERVEKVKGYILETLRKIESKKKDKENLDEQLRILKMDLEDLRNGRFEKIEERIEKSKVARLVSVVPISVSTYNGITNLAGTFTVGTSIGNVVSGTCTTQDFNWNNATCGTYTVGTKSFYFN